MFLKLCLSLFVQAGKTVRRKTVAKSKTKISTQVFCSTDGAVGFPCQCTAGIMSYLFWFLLEVRALLSFLSLFLQLI